MDWFDVRELETDLTALRGFLFDIARNQERFSVLGLSELKKIEGESVSIVELHKTVVENYTSYYECSIKVDEWNEWYVQQKKIFEEVK